MSSGQDFWDYDKPFLSRFWRMKLTDTLRISQRILITIQLCAVFASICWTLMDPFLSELYDYRQSSLIYQQVLGSDDLAERLQGDEAASDRALLKRNQLRFQNLPYLTQEKLINEYNRLQEGSLQPWATKLAAGIHRLLFGLPVFQRAWIAFSLVLCLLTLYGMEAAKKSLWLIPLILIFHLVDLSSVGLHSSSRADEQLFPPEQYIWNTYIQEPQSSSVLEQKKQLTMGWKRYLVDHWTRESIDPKRLDQQAESGEYSFQLKRLELLSASDHKSTPSSSVLWPIIGFLFSVLLWWRVSL